MRKIPKLICRFFHWAICFISFPAQSLPLTVLVSKGNCRRGSHCGLEGVFFSERSRFSLRRSLEEVYSSVVAFPSFSILYSY